MLNYAIVDELLQQKFQITEDFKFVDPSEINVRTARPKWTWVARVCHEIPVGKCVMLPVPENMNINVFMDNLRCSLSSSKTTNMDKFSIRRHKLEQYVVVMKSGTWAKLYRSMESAHD